MALCRATEIQGNTILNAMLLLNDGWLVFFMLLGNVLHREHNTVLPCL